MSTKYTSIDEIIEANQRAGGYFFSPATMRDFRTRVHPEIYGGTVFTISNKKSTDKWRVYRVCEIKPNGTIKYITEGNITSLPLARQIARAYVAGVKVYKVAYVTEEGKRASVVIHRYGREPRHYYHPTTASSARLEKLLGLSDRNNVGVYSSNVFIHCNCE